MNDDSSRNELTSSRFYLTDSRLSLNVEALGLICWSGRILLEDFGCKRSTDCIRLSTGLYP